MGDVAPFGSDMASLLFETCTDALGTGILVFSKSDHLVAVSRNIGNFYPVSSEFLQRGVSLRSFLGALFEVAFGSGDAGTTRSGTSREEWISNRIAAMWHERGETIEKTGRERWLSVTTRRLANGIGVLMVQDVSAHRKMEDRWRADLERVAMTEEILDNLPPMLFILDRNLNHVAVNKAYSRFRGLPPESLLDRGLAEVLEPDLALRCEAEGREVLATGKAISSYQEIERGGRPMRLLLQRFRLGTPGHYFVANLCQEISMEPPAMATVSGASERAMEAVPLLESAIEVVRERFDPAPPDASAVIVLSSNEAFGRALDNAMRGFRFDSCHANDLDEVRAILAAAGEAGLTVDLILADDSDADASMVRMLGPKVLPVSRARPVHFAVAEAAAAVTIGTVSHAWEQDSDYLPDFPMPDRVPDPSGLGVELIVVEDNLINQEVYAQILGGLGISYELARDGEEAVRLWELLRPPLILMDLDLPGMSGLEATMRIRAAERDPSHRTTIIGVMPRPSQERHDKSIAAGMDETIIKPLAVEVIDGVCKRYTFSNPHHERTELASAY